MRVMDWLALIFCGAWDDEGYALAMEIRALKEKE